MKTPLDSDNGRAAFTAVELVATLAVVTLLLMCVLASARAGSRTGGPTFQCLENTRRLVAAWLMYAADNRDTLAVNLQGSQAQGGNYSPFVGPGWAAGWLDWTTATDNTNLHFISDKRWASLAPYTGFTSRILKCPADTYLSPAQIARGWTGRVRSYSLGVGLGQGNAESGPWDSIYRHLTKSIEMRYPAPAQTFVFIDEDSDSINDPAFFSPSQASLMDIPAARHNGAGTMAFADGHAEIHKWAGALNPEADIHWLSFHSQRVSEESY